MRPRRWQALEGSPEEVADQLQELHAADRLVEDSGGHPHLHLAVAWDSREPEPPGPGAPPRVWTRSRMRTVALVLVACGRERECQGCGGTGGPDNSCAGCGGTGTVPRGQDPVTGDPTTTPPYPPEEP